MTDEYEKALTRAARFLSSKARTVEELRELLLDREHVKPGVAEKVIERLKELGYLNDERYAADLASRRLGAKPIGKRRMTAELKRRKFQELLVDSTVDAAYELRKESDLVDEAIQIRIRTRGVPTTRQELKNLYDHLIRLGFEYEMIRQGLSRIPKLELETSHELET
ncbi:MAG: RecX family transcriptional regulator [Acidobacteria bacterium]|nr:RecX family transcriptional regulator [Acidobacteriota bacterium]